MADDNKIPFIQFMLPDGRQEETILTAESPSTAKMASEILMTKRYRFECEVLRTGQVSVTCADRQEEEDIAIEICQNGPAVPVAVSKMVKEAYGIIFPDKAQPFIRFGVQLHPCALVQNMFAAS